MPWRAKALALAVSLAACAPPPQADLAAPPAPILALSEVPLADGFRMAPAASGLVDPVDVTFDAGGVPYVLEAGPPGVLSRLEPGGTLTIVARGEPDEAWTAAASAGGAVHVLAADAAGGTVLRLEADGRAVPVVEGLPPGAHAGRAAARGPDGLLHFAHGSASRIGIAAPGRPGDVPCQNVLLAGGIQIPGRLPCNGAVFRLVPGEGPELVAWGFRDPAALAVAPDGSLFVLDSGPSEEEGRMAEAAGDVVWVVRRGVWYGWPDFWAGRPLAPPLLLAHPNPPPAPLALLDASATALAISPAAEFGPPGGLFIAQAEGGAGRVVRLDPASGEILHFVGAVLRDPVALRFSPDGSGLFVVDRGSGQGDGIVWRIEPIPSAIAELPAAAAEPLPPDAEFAAAATPPVALLPRGF